ncbi:MAG TPA: diguanylate cyclase [bacterium]|nr:diguanylate cyclase [bacterium]
MLIVGDRPSNSDLTVHEPRRHGFVESPNVDAFPKEPREFLETFAVLAALAILRAQRDENLSQLALTDGLAGLANHRAILQDLEREIDRCKRINDKSVSIGLAAHPADGDDPDGLLESADHAMYQTKRDGGNRVCVT